MSAEPGLYVSRVLNLQRYDGDRELTRRVIKIQIMRMRKVQEVGHRGRDTQGRAPCG
jgi:hypothetical protein